MTNHAQRIIGFEVKTELARSKCKKLELSISQYGMSNPVNK